MQMQSMGVEYSTVVCYVLTGREPWSLNSVQISLCAHTLLHVLYVPNVHQAVWICNFSDTNTDAQIEEISKILASNLKN